jgi:ferredoxin-NADP reductase
MIHNLKLTAKEEIAPDTFAFYFDTTGTNFTFTAGQFVTVTIPDLNAADGKGNERHYSIANALGEDNLIEIIIRKSNSDFSRCILNLPMGSELLFDNPRGEITGDKIGDSSSIPVFIAGGTGITPVRSILKDFDLKQSEKDVILFYANRSKESAVFIEELLELSKRKKSFNFIPIFEEETDIKNSEIGYFSEEILKKHIKDFTNHVFYITGPPMMLSETIKVLVNCGIPDEMIVIENI